MKINKDKTEETLIDRSKENKYEKWTDVKKLGSLPGSYKDMERRIKLSCTPFSNKKIWLKENILIKKTNAA